MANAVPLPSIDSLSGADARMEALDKLEELVSEVAAEKKRQRSNICLKRAIKIWRRGNHPGSAQWALRATEIDDTNSKAFHVLAMALERMGHLHKSLITYERAYQLDPEDPELLINLGLAALEHEADRRGGEDVPPLHRRLPGIAIGLQQSGQRAM